MQPLDVIDVWIKKMQHADITEVLSISDQDEWKTPSLEQRSERLKVILGNPVDDFSVVYRWYFRMKWFQALRTIEANTPITLLEIGAGDTDMIPQILAKKYEHPDTCYRTANMNKKLTISLKEKTKNLPIKIDVIEDAAQNSSLIISIMRGSTCHQSPFVVSIPSRSPSIACSTSFTLCSKATTSK